ncbi:MAG: sterol desaturase [Nitrospirales bacterium]|nr:MAG: sterol desaturase [Nitrospirales bacterium]
MTNTLVLRTMFLSGVFGVAVLAETYEWGILNSIIWPGWSEILVAIIVLDFVVYGQHVLFHTLPILWCLHKVHHSDIELDVTTGVRFHPGEIVISMLIKIGTVLVIGASPESVLIFEVLLNAMAMFNHSNIRIPLQIDAGLRWMVVTPDMHRVHHSVITEESNRNYGFNLPWWDRIFGTYQAQPSLGHDHMTIGLERFREPAQLTFTSLLTLPFVEERVIQQPDQRALDHIAQGSKTRQDEKTVKTNEQVLTTKCSSVTLSP